VLGGEIGRHAVAHRKRGDLGRAGALGGERIDGIGRARRARR
jgi:hypothetical protein